MKYEWNHREAGDVDGKGEVMRRKKSREKLYEQILIYLYLRTTVLSIDADSETKSARQRWICGH